MKKHLLLLALLASAAPVFAQKLPVRTATIFKNGQSLLLKSGKVAAPGGKFSTTELPAALFGTFWAGGPEVQSVFSVQDSVVRADSTFDQALFFKNNRGRAGKFFLTAWGNAAPEFVEGTLDKTSDKTLLIRTNTGKWVNLQVAQIARAEFAEQPVFETIAKHKAAQNRLTINFKNARPEQDLTLAYLTNGIGWTPIYKLDLTDKNRGRLALRAEIFNDTEDLGDAELRLAVGVPNFKYATRPGTLVNFGRELVVGFNRDFDMDLRQMQNIAYQNAAYFERDDRAGAASGGDNFEGAQAEDFYFYTVRPGLFPKNSRYQFPIFEADIVPTHFFECVLPTATPGGVVAYKQSGGRGDERHEVTHFVEFQNNTKFPWTTGAANISAKAGDDLQPISQDMLPYTPAGAKCKVKIAQSPEVKVTHAEGDVDREENAKRFFSNTYDRVKIEGQVCVVNYKNEPITLKIRRAIEGTPGQSDQKWALTQEQATLRVNPSYTAEWTLELKPGEERKWKYNYEVFVNY